MVEETLIRGTRKAAKFLGVSPCTFLRLVKAGKVPFVQILSNRYYEPSELNKLKVASVTTEGMGGE